jgi:RimJ/RimL family protein N-acetyltransferase
VTQTLRSQKVGAAFAMTTPHELRTDRLRLRRWIPADLAPFATLNADPMVTEYLPGPLSQAESAAFVARIETHFDEYGFGLWAVEIRHAASFAGFIGLLVPRFESHFTPCVEIGWRLGAEHWSHGYGGRSSCARVRFRSTWAYGSHIVHGTGKCSLASRDGKDRDGPQGVRRF